MKTENTKEDYIINKDKQYLVVNEEKLKTNLTSMIKQLENVYYDDIEECYFYYGGGKIPVANESGTELECKENLKLIIDFLPIMKSCIKVNDINEFAMALIKEEEYYKNEKQKKYDLAETNYLYKIDREDKQQFREQEEIICKKKEVLNSMISDLLKP